MRIRFSILHLLLIALALLAAVCARTASAQMPPPHMPHLYSQGGRVLHSPRVHLIYYQDDWNNINPEPDFKKENIDQWVAKFMSSNYFAKASQYFDDSSDGIHAGYLADSNNSALGNPLDTTDPFSIHVWLAYEIWAPFTGVPYPTSNDDVYVVILPRNNPIRGNENVQNYTGYHFFMPVSLPIPFGFPLIPPFYLLSPYTMLTMQGALATFDTDHNPNEFYTNFDGLTSLFSHEMIEACTDPIDTFVGSVPGLDGIITGLLARPDANPGWFDFSLSPGDWFTKSEAADICEFDPYFPHVWYKMDDGTYSVVSAYWSNEDNAPVCGDQLVRNLFMIQTGIPATIRVPATFDGRTLSVNWTNGKTDKKNHSNYFGVQVVEGTAHTYSFTPIVNDPANPGIRYVTTKAPGSVTATGPETDIVANYNTQYNVAVHTFPPAAATGNVSLTKSDWYPAGSFTLNADADVPAGVGKRYHFGSWFVKELPIGSAVFFNSPNVTFLLSKPIDATANYAVQDQLTVNTSGLGTNTTHITNGTTVLGTATDAAPLSVWINDGSALNLQADALVSDPNGPQYFFDSFSPAPPATMSAPFTTTATYKTMAQILNGGLASGGIYGPGSNGIENSLEQKWAAVEAAIARGDYVAALGKIKAFINEVQAQEGKHITVAFSKMLQTNALRVFYNVLVMAKNAGQLNAIQVDTEYSYYQDLLTSLGGTPLPHP